MTPAATTIAWFRRDLRLHDLPMLADAADGARTLAPLYVLDPALLRGRWSSSNRTWFLLESLRSLDVDLRALGSRLHIRVGDPREVVPAFAVAIGAARVHVTGDVSPYARRRDGAVAASLRECGCDFREHEGLLVHSPAAVATRDGRPYVVFGPYRRTWDALARRSVIAAPAHLPPPPGEDPGHVPDLGELGLEPPTADPAAFPAPGERAARLRMESWLRRGVDAYAKTRDRLDDRAATSRLSQDLRFGLLSPLELVDRALAGEEAPSLDDVASRDLSPVGHAARAAHPALAVQLRLPVEAGPPRVARDDETHRDRSTAARDVVAGRTAWLSELCWRDFYLQLLAHHPDVLERPFRRAFERMAWVEDDAAFDAWREGRTGYPVVDAAMRQLRATGFMPNRARMIVASFLAKDLGLDWRRGETHFMRHLIDGEPAANDGGWQWTASTGTDAQPWFRVFDPVSQGERFDPDGAWVRRWIPELDRVPTEHVHAPWAMPDEQQRIVDCVIGRDYPAPIVDHRTARARWLASVADAGISARERTR